MLDSNGEPISLGLEGLCGNEINHIVRARAKEAGLGWDEFGVERPWGAHSLRRGWLTEGARQGIGLSELMAHSGHLSHESVMCYIQAASRWSTKNSAPLKMRYSFEPAALSGGVSGDRPKASTLAVSPATAAA